MGCLAYEARLATTFLLGVYTRYSTGLSKNLESWSCRLADKTWIHKDAAK
jgi:hypothetical protein